jgi:hypothetical protein
MQDFSEFGKFESIGMWHAENSNSISIVFPVFNDPGSVKLSWIDKFDDVFNSQISGAAHVSECN